LDSTDAKQRAAGAALLEELAKWLGEASLGFLFSKLSDKEAASLRKKLKAAPTKPQDMVPPKALRCPNSDSNERGSGGGGEWEWERDASGCVVVDLVEPRDLGEELRKTDFKERMKSDKWQDKVKAMETVVSKVGVE
jgi:hypothetical protein